MRHTLRLFGLIFSAILAAGCTHINGQTEANPAVENGQAADGQIDSGPVDARVFGHANPDEVDRLVVKSIDREQLEAQERRRGKNAERPQPYRFAVAEKVAVGLDDHGTWQETPDGRVWRLRIHAPNALSISLGFSRFDLPRGAALRISSLDGEQTQGPYTAKNRSNKGRLWTAIVESDEILVELFVPRGARANVEIESVNKAFRPFAKGGGLKSGACNNDVICPVGDPWRDQIRSVGVYSIGGAFACTGTMVNNTALDFTPYLLSARHCNVTATNDDTVVVYWNYESPNCGDLGGGSLADNQSGSILRASYATSDLLLLELSAMPDPAFNVFYSGWDATGSAPATTVGIHHPSTDEKAISFNNNAVTSTAYLSDTVSATANYWRIDDWEDGTTEPGSSGSCLWHGTSKRCVGTLTGGYAACPDENERDWYGKFSAHWTGGGTNATRLSNWLDPINNGVLVLNGDPHITTLDGTHYDFQGAGEFVALRDGEEAEVQVRQAAIPTTFNPGPDAYHGLATCVSLNTAVAARVGKHRVTYQPNLNGRPDPSGLQLRIDGELASLDNAGINLSGGGRIEKTSAPGGIEVTFPDRYTLVVTPGWWASQEKWYLNVSLARDEALAVSGASPNSGLRAAGGLAGEIPRGSWLPRLPDGSAFGAMPASLNERYDALYKKFGNAWRVRQRDSLFDYAPGTSTDTFTIESWPPLSGNCELPDARPVEPAPREDAVQACRGVEDSQTRADCIFDVMVTGEVGFATTYLHSQRTQPGRMCPSLRNEENHYKECDR
jgi:lysyl endopeptidase